MKATLEQWRMLKAVVEHGGFAPASEAIFKSQSSIHTAVQKLQHSLGIPLLEVKGRKALLTSQGQILLRRAEQMLAEAQKLEDIAVGFEQGIEPLVNIAVDAAFPADTIFTVLSQLSERYPQTNVELYETVLGGSNELLLKQTVDIAISTHIPKGVMSYPLISETFIPVCAPTHPLMQLEQVTFADLKRHRQIVIRDSASDRKQEGGWLGANQRWTVDHMRTSIELLCQGKGYAHMPINAVKQLLADNQLAELNIENKVNGQANFVLLTHDIDMLGPASRYLFDSLLIATRAKVC